MSNVTLCSIGEITPDNVGESFYVRGFLQKVQGKSKVVFLLLRQRFSTIQAVLSASDDIPKPMIKYVTSLPKESIVDVYVTVSLPTDAITSSTQKMVELHVSKIFCISKASPLLPFQVMTIF